MESVFASFCSLNYRTCCIGIASVKKHVNNNIGIY